MITERDLIEIGFVKKYNYFEKCINSNLYVFINLNPFNLSLDNKKTGYTNELLVSTYNPDKEILNNFLKYLDAISL